VDAEIGANVPLPRGRQGPGLVTFEAEASVEELEDYRNILATFAPDLPVAPSGGTELRLSGTTELDLDLFDLTVDARTQDLKLGQRAFDAVFAGEGRLQGRVIRTGFDALRVEDLRVDTPLLDGTLTADLGEGTGTADLDLRLTDVEPVMGGLSGPGAVTGTAARAADGSTALDLDLSLPTGTASVDGTLASDGGVQTFTGDLAADLGDISPLGTLLGRDLAGAVQGTASGTARLDLSTLDLTFDLATEDLELGIPRLDPFLAGQGTFTGRAARDGDDLRLDAVRIDTDLLDGTVSAQIEDGVGSADIDLALADVEPVLGGIEGPAACPAPPARPPRAPPPSTSTCPSPPGRRKWRARWARPRTATSSPATSWPTSRTWLRWARFSSATSEGSSGPTCPAPSAPICRRST
jgi:translocation and assembly module TamB